MRGAAKQTDDALAAFVSTVWSVRDDRYSEVRTLATLQHRPVDLDPGRVEMSRIGG